MNNQQIGDGFAYFLLWVWGCLILFGALGSVGELAAFFLQKRHDKDGK